MVTLLELQRIEVEREQAESPRKKVSSDAHPPEYWERQLVDFHLRNSATEQTARRKPHCAEDHISEQMTQSRQIEVVEMSASGRTPVKEEPIETNRFTYSVKQVPIEGSHGAVRGRCISPSYWTIVRTGAYAKSPYPVIPLCLGVWQ